MTEVLGHLSSLDSGLLISVGTLAMYGIRMAIVPLTEVEKRVITSLLLNISIQIITLMGKWHKEHRADIVVVKEVVHDMKRNLADKKVVG